MKFPLRCIVFFILAFATALTIQAQTIDTQILGNVTDSTGAALPGATVTITSSATGISKTAVTGEQGQYAVTYLTPGSYNVSLQANGFAKQVRQGIVLQIGQQQKVDFALSVSAQQESVVVQGGQTLLQTENASLGEVVGPERTENLPLNGRKFDDLAILTPGVTVYNPDIHSSSTDGSAISANGGRAQWGQVNIDGIAMVNNRHNYVNLYPSIDAIQEFKVQTGNYSAEYGGNAGSNVNIQLKSGTNNFHGDVFDFIRNDAVDARNYFIPAPIPKNILKQNQFGGTVGGPLIRNKTFGFFSYEGLRSVQEFPQTTRVLTAAERQGDFSADGVTIYNPNTREQYQNATIPRDQIDPVAANLLSYMPMPNLAAAPGDNNYAGSSKGNLSVNQYLGRLDHYFNDKNQLMIHYIYANRNFPIRELNPNFTFTGKYPAQNMALQYIHVFSPSLLNAVRFGANLEHVQQLSTRTGTDFTIESLGINGFKVGGPNGRPLRSNEEGFPLLDISSFIGMGDDLAGSNIDDSRTYQLVDDLTWTKGRHTITVGADIRYLMDNATSNNTPFGQMQFTNDITANPNDSSDGSGFSAAAYLLGYPRTVTTPEGVPITKARQWRSAEYIQDNWKVAPNFTLNLGLRYDLFAPPVDVNNVTRTLDWSQPVPVFTPAPGARLNNIWKVGHKDFGPRIGFAYNVTPTTVVRGAYGIFFFGGQFDNINILQLNPPVAGSLTLTNPAANPVATIETPVPVALYPENPYFNAVTLTKDGKHPDLYMQTWNLTASRQFGNNVFDLTYVGTKGTNIDTSIKNYNSPPPGPGDIQSRRPYNTFARIRYPDYKGASSYAALQAHFEHRLSHGVSFTAAYTWSHLLDNSQLDSQNGGCDCQDPTRPHEWASGLTDQRHNLAVGYVWQLPGLKSKSLVTEAVNGWSLEGLLLFAAGSPFNVEMGNDSQNTDSAGYGEKPNLVPGQKLTVSNRGPNAWFNTNAFTPSVYEYGNSPRNPLTAPPTRTLNLTLMKTFQMPYAEAQKLEFRFEAFNAFNTPQFGAPDASVGDSSFGQISNTAQDNRELQLALKYFF